MGNTQAHRYVMTLVAVSRAYFAETSLLDAIVLVSPLRLRYVSPLANSNNAQSKKQTGVSANERMQPLSICALVMCMC